MSQTRVKTTYSKQGNFGATDIVELFCVHCHTSDTTHFYHADGSVPILVFEQWDNGNDLWDGVCRLMHPFQSEWGGTLKDRVEFFDFGPWESDFKCST